MGRNAGARLARLAVARLLAALVAAFTLYLTSSVYYATGPVRVCPHFFGVSYPMPWTFGPLGYLYAVAASDRWWCFARRDLLHRLPVGIAVAVGAPFYMRSGAGKIALHDRILAGDLPAPRADRPVRVSAGIA